MSLSYSAANSEPAMSQPQNSAHGGVASSRIEETTTPLLALLPPVSEAVLQCTLDGNP